MRYPEPIVGEFIINKKGEILLVKSPKWGKGRIWTVAGGHVNIGEIIEEAIKREVMEELGIKIKFVEVFTVFESIFNKNFFKNKHFIFLECKCMMLPNQKINIDNKEILSCQWFSLKKALKLNLEEYTRKSIELLADE